MLVKAQLHGGLHGLDLGSAVPIQALHLSLALLAGPLSRWFHGAACLVIQVVVSVHIVFQALLVQLLLPPWEQANMVNWGEFRGTQTYSGQSSKSP